MTNSEITSDMLKQTDVSIENSKRQRRLIYGLLALNVACAVFFAFYGARWGRYVLPCVFAVGAVVNVISLRAVRDTLRLLKARRLIIEANQHGQCLQEQ